MNQVAVMVLVFVVAGLAAACSAPADETNAGERPSAAATFDPHGDHAAAEPPPKDKAKAVAAAFAAAFADTDAASWWSAVSAYCYRDLAVDLKTVDPTRVPFSKVTGKPRAAAATDEANTAYTVAVDTGVLTIRLAALDGVWKVYTYAFKAGS